VREINEFPIEHGDDEPIAKLPDWTRVVGPLSLKKEEAPLGGEASQGSFRGTEPMTGEGISTVTAQN
jgi:hypothetical protein